VELLPQAVPALLCSFPAIDVCQCDLQQQHLMLPGWIHQRSSQQGLLFNPQTIIIGITLDSIATL
jgi:hypothetical protein